MLLCRSRPIGRLGAALAATGRMALSNYLLQTLVFVLVFNGWAMAQWGTWTITEQAAMVAGVWLVQVVISSLWLQRFRFGPMEWLWRSLSYRRLQSMHGRE